MFDFLSEPRYVGCFSVSDKEGSIKTNYTYTFNFKPTRMEDIGFDALIGLGFSPMIFEGGHRNTANCIGMTDLGYVDIDTKEGMIPVPERVFEEWSCYRSKSRNPGRFRIFYRRPFVVQDSKIVSIDGIILKDLDGYFVPGVIGQLLGQERDWFLELVPEASDYFDITALQPSMHSKRIGEKVYDNEIKLVELGAYNFDALEVGGRHGSNFEIGSVTEFGMISHWQRVVRGNTETLYLKTGNILEAGVGGMIKEVTLGEAIRESYQLCDPIGSSITTGFQRYPDVGDAYMKMKLYLDGSRLYASAWGQHDGNHKEKSRIVVSFDEGEIEDKYVTRAVVDGIGIEIDEKNKTFRIKKDNDDNRN